MNIRLHKLLTALFALSILISGVPASAQTVEELFRQGIEAYNEQKYTEAERIWRKIIQLNPEHTGAYVNLCLLLGQKGKLDEAIKNCQQALSLPEVKTSTGSAHTIAHTNMGLALLKQEKVDEAIENFQTAIQLDPKYAKAYFGLGIALAEQEKVDEAIENFQTAIQLDLESAEVYYVLGLALNEQGKLDEAIQNYQKAIQLNPEYAKAYSDLGVTLYRQGKVDEATENFQTAIQLDPEYARAYGNLGLVLAEKGKLDEAINYSQKAIQLDPKLAIVYNNLGKILRDQGKVDEAIQNFQTAIQLDPQYVTAHYNLGRTLHGQGRVDEAVENYKKAIQIDPEFAATYVNLGLLLVRQGKVDEGIENYNKALSLPESTDVFGIENVHALAHSNLGYALQKQGKLEEAIVEYQKAIALDPDYVTARNGLREAKRLLEQQSRPPEPEIDELAYIPSLEEEPLRDILRATARITSEIPDSQEQRFIIGAGWVVKREGDTVWIVTCRHVVANKALQRPTEEIGVEFFSELDDARRPRHQATLVQVSDNLDLDIALLKVTGVPEDVKPLKIDDNRMSRNTPIKAIGHPFNNPDPWNSSSGEVTNYNPNKPRFSIDANVAQGNSGGPIIHAETQKVIGIMVSIYGEGDIAIDTEEAAPDIAPDTYATGSYGIAYRIGVVIELLREWGIQLEGT